MDTIPTDWHTHIVRAFFTVAEFITPLENPCKIIEFDTHLLSKDLYVTPEDLAAVSGMSGSGLFNEDVEAPLEFPIIQHKTGDFLMQA